MALTRKQRPTCRGCSWRVSTGCAASARGCAFLLAGALPGVPLRLALCTSQPPRGLSA